MRKLSTCKYVVALLLCSCLPVIVKAAAPGKTINIVTVPSHHARITYGVQIKLQQVLARVLIFMWVY
jgi:hypothetical protein